MTILRSPRPHHEVDYCPMMVTAKLDGPIVLTQHPPALDALLAYAIAQELGLPPLEAQGDEPPQIEIPIARSPCGRYHLATFGIGRTERSELSYFTRKFPIEVGQAIGNAKLNTIEVSSGRNKSFRLPQERMHLEDDRLIWFAIGHVPEVRALLSWVTRLGRKRSQGAGRVAFWEVTEVKAWGLGFPCVTPEGRALRPLPLDDARVDRNNPRERLVPSFPYFERWREEECFAPAWGLR
jgi:hypothetical protein